jgi:hypothetical protein
MDTALVTSSERSGDEFEALANLAAATTLDRSTVKDSQSVQGSINYSNLDR